MGKTVNSKGIEHCCGEGWRYDSRAVHIWSDSSSASSRTQRLAPTLCHMGWGIIRWDVLRSYCCNSGI